MQRCIDLKRQFGAEYRIEPEESYKAEHGENGRVCDPWSHTIPCAHGHIYPHGGELLGLSTNKRGAIARRLESLRCVKVVQDGSDGINVVFHVRHFDEVAAIIKPKRRRKLSREHRAKLIPAGIEALAHYRNSIGRFTARSRDPTTKPDH